MFRRGIYIKRNSIDNYQFIGTFYVFLYIFSFYIIGPITSSILAATIPLFSMTKMSMRRYVYNNFCSKYAVGLLSINIGLIALGILYSLLHGTYDLSYIKTLFAQFIHIVCGIVIISYLKYKYQIDTTKIIQLIIYAYLIQSLIEVVASAVPSLATFLTFFNRASDAQEESGGVRGMALASSTTWGLGLTYGLVFIIYTYRYMLNRLSWKTVLGWLVLVLGTFFAGRTGFVGAALGIAYFIIFSKYSIINASQFILYAVLILIVLVTILFAIFPDYIEYMIFNVLPWAIEPVFNFIDGKGFSTGSTDVLDTMWNRPMTDLEFLFGTGWFTNADGSYYLHTDVGVLRNLFYWGIIGYIALIGYQLYVMYPLFCLDKGYLILGLVIVVYLAFGEYKAVTIGLNKMTFSILFLISSFSLPYRGYRTDNCK